MDLRSRKNEKEKKEQTGQGEENENVPEANSISLLSGKNQNEDIVQNSAGINDLFQALSSTEQLQSCDSVRFCKLDANSSESDTETESSDSDGEEETESEASSSDN